MRAGDAEHELEASARHDQARKASPLPTEAQASGQQYLAIPWNTSQAVSMGTKIIIFPPTIMVRNLTVLPLCV
jgi:hypothetical protein